MPKGRYPRTPKDKDSKKHLLSNKSNVVLSDHVQAALAHFRKTTGKQHPFQGTPAQQQKYWQMLESERSDKRSAN